LSEISDSATALFFFRSEVTDTSTFFQNSLPGREFSCILALGLLLISVLEVILINTDRQGISRTRQMDSRPMPLDLRPRQARSFIRPFFGPTARPIFRRFLGPHRCDPTSSPPHASPPLLGLRPPGTARPTAAYQVGALNPIPAPWRLTSPARFLTLHS